MGYRNDIGSTLGDYGMTNLSGRLVFYLVALASIFVILFGIRGSASIINPILLAAVITIAVLPIPGRLKKRGLPGWLSLVLTIGMVALVLALVIVTVFVSITKLSTELPQYVDGAAQQSAEDIEAATGSDASSDTAATAGELGELALAVLTRVLELLSQIALALVIFFFMLSAAVTLPGPTRLGLDPESPAIMRVSHYTEDIRKYLSVLTMINLLVGVGDTVFLLILGVDFAVLWGLLAWLMGYIPSIGFMIALVPPVLMAYAQYGLQTALIVLIGYVLINGGVQNFIQPKRMGDSLKISPLVVFVSLFVWGYLLGGIGAILAVPLTMLIVLALENFPGTRTMAVLMRYTGETKSEEKQEALQEVRGLWDRMRRPFGADRESKDADGGQSPSPLFVQDDRETAADARAYDETAPNPIVESNTDSSKR
jgi:predicted PurR-regulated permease PerM